jgi:hypothetical protein
MAYDAKNEVFRPRIRRHPKLNVPAFVIGCDQRDGLILPYLADQDHTLHIGTDYDLPPDAKPMLQPYSKCSPLLSNYRIFRSHQDAAAKFLKTGEPIGLFFEDDAVPVDDNWANVVNEAVSLLTPQPSTPTSPVTENKQVFYLYGREFEAGRFQTRGSIGKYEVKTLRNGAANQTEDFGGRVKVFGSLAYLLTQYAARDFVRTDWGGVPVDVVLADLCQFRFLSPSPFVHDRSQGSLNYPSFDGVRLANDPGK